METIPTPDIGKVASVEHRGKKSYRSVSGLILFVKQAVLIIILRSALTGPISPDQRPTPSVPPNENCAAGYHYLQASAKCVISSYGAQSWQVSRDYCIQNGGELVSINSPEDQQEIYTIFALSDATAEGKLNFSFNSQKTETDLSFKVFRSLLRISKYFQVENVKKKIEHELKTNCFIIC